MLYLCICYAVNKEEFWHCSLEKKPWKKYILNWMILMMIMWLYKLIIGCIIVIDSPFIIERLWYFDCIVSWNSFSPRKVYMKKIYRLLFVWHSFEDLFFGKSLCLSVHKYSKLQWSNWVDMNWHNELLATWVATVVAIANNTSTPRLHFQDGQNFSVSASSIAQPIKTSRKNVGKH